MNNKQYPVKSKKKEKGNLTRNKDGYQRLIEELMDDVPSNNSFEKKIFSKILVYKGFMTLIVICLIFSFNYIENTREFKDNKLETFLKFNLEGKLYYLTSNFYKREKPDISVIITTFNGEVYLEPVLRSVQNQHFSNMEIIIVDDCSMDDTVKKINSLMEYDRRIILIKNEKNKGTLYSKTCGVLNAKGKYVIFLDQDQLYSTKFSFSTLYNESETNDLDILGFTSMVTPIQINKSTELINYIETPIIHKPDIKKRFLGSNSKEQSRTFLFLYFIKTKLFMNVIKQLGDNIINKDIEAHYDTILVFALSRSAVRLKHLKDIIHLKLKWPSEYTKAQKFQDESKKLREKKNCISYVTFAEVVFMLTENEKGDKNLAERMLFDWVINNKECRNPRDAKNDAKRVCNLYLKNNFISQRGKRDINSYLNRIK